MNWLDTFWLLLICTYSNLPAITCVKIMRLKECNKYFGIFSQIYSNRRLKNNNIAITISKITENHCVYACIQNLKCESVGYLSKEQLCHLHLVKINTIVEDLEEANGWVYMEPDDEKQVRNYGPVCQRLKPCNHGNCTDDCSSTGYKCECEGCYYGQQCDKHVKDLPWATWSPCIGTCTTGRISRQRKKVTSPFAVDIWTTCEENNVIEVESCTPSIDFCFDILLFCLDKIDGSMHAHPDPEKFITCSNKLAVVRTCSPGLVWKQEQLTCNYPN